MGVAGKYKFLHSGYIYSYPQNVVQAYCTSDYRAYWLVFKNFAYNSSGTPIADQWINCTAAGDQKFNSSSYESTVKCEDPKAFCTGRFGALNKTTSAASGCDANCVKNGRCQLRDGESDFKCWCYSDGHTSYNGSCPAITW